MPYFSTSQFCHYAWFVNKPSIRILPLLIVHFIVPANYSAAQIICDSDPKVIDTSTDTSKGIECSNNDDAEIILEKGVKIEPSSNPGISISNSEDFTVRANGDTLIKTTANSQHGVVGNEINGLVLELDDIELTGERVHGIWIESDPANPGSLITIEVDNITLSGRDSSNITPFAGIRARAPGQVDITSTGKITTLGQNVDGILVENPIGSNGGSIDISVNDIETQGIDSDGIRVTSIGNDTPFFEREIGITVNGTVKTSGQFAQGVIVEFADSNINVDINPGGKVIAENIDTNTFALALIGTQIGSDLYYNKTALVENKGIVSGNILTEGCARFNNHGTTISQDLMEISSTNCDTIGMDSGFFNFGTVDVGGKNEFQTTEFTGSYIQTSSGKLQIDVDWSNDKTDRLSIVGNASLDGNLVVNSLAFPDFTEFVIEKGVDFAGKEIKSITFLDTSDGIIGNFQNPPIISLLLSNRITKSEDNTELKLSLIFGEGLGLLNRNQTNVFWGLFDSSPRSNGINEVFLDLFEEVELSSLQKTLDSFGNEIAGAAVRSEFRNMESLALPNDYCENKPTGQAGELNRHTPKECKFFTAKILRGAHSGNFEQREHDADLLEGIFRVPLFENKADGQIQLLGQINKTRIKLSDLAKSDGHFGTLGLGYYQEGDYGELSLLAHLGMGSHEISRNFTVIDESLTSIGTLDTRSAGISAEISNSFKIWNGSLNWYARVGYSGVKSKSYTEFGGEDFSLVVDKTSTKSLVINPRFEYVGQNRNFQTLVIQPVVGGGILHRTKPAIEFHSKFVAGGNEILSTTVLPKTEFNYFLGTKLSRPDKNLKGEIGYSRYYSNNESLSGNSLSAKLIMHF
ncbi:MAG: autotransporter outer membrane beta-barrel domain-containing protein [Paracoccaceae bacterium]|nr:autotransporter outer membrane beta-barrel domain-containing protein [Paracoccaceae bacterium]MDE2673617.1 autotransporter outer membrane beta-barrel domain-containing protein [Paracoccaceae bacterium]